MLLHFIKMIPYNIIAFIFNVYVRMNEEWLKRLPSSSPSTSASSSAPSSDRLESLNERELEELTMSYCDFFAGLITTPDGAVAI